MRSRKRPLPRPFRTQLSKRLLVRSQGRDARSDANNFETNPCAETPGDAAIRDDRISTLTSFEARVALANHEHLAAPAHDLAVAVPLLGGLQGRKHLHGGLLGNDLAETKRESVACITTCRKPADRPEPGGYPTGFRIQTFRSERRGSRSRPDLRQHHPFPVG